VPSEPARINAMKSMTGFGRGRQLVGDVEFVVELRAVNHRYLDLSIKTPRLYNLFEPEIRKIIGRKVHRGRLDVLVTRKGGTGALVDVVFDRELANNYHRCLVSLKQDLGLAGEITVSDVLTLKDVVTPVEKEEAVEGEWQHVRACLDQGLEQLDAMRIAEGEALWSDVESRLGHIRETACLVAPLVGQVSRLAKERLEKRVKELTGGLELDPDRLLQEVALIAERADTTEELTRLESHVEQFLNSRDTGSPIGRKLDFLLQEIHREVNTISAKSASTDIAGHVVAIKAEVEKIREQIQNLE
jgi:uncharacterized protein (TIGR00255 family)